MEGSKAESLKFVIVGHVDHGKSTLIGRLLFDTKSLPDDKIEEIKKISKKLNKETEFAFLLDHLQEEREQGITIDTTQTFFKDKAKNKEYVIIDAPGHVEFIKNMITGASQADAGILIIDVTEGIKEQTKRHANILSMLGIKQVIVALNKMDLADYKEEIFRQVKRKAEEFLGSLDIKPKYYIPVSALKGENIVNKSEKMRWYEGPTILEALDAFETNDLSKKEILLFPVQDIYEINGKTIYVGRIESGKIRVGQKLKVLPSGEITEVKTIEKFNEIVKESQAGENIGITLANSLSIERGNVFCESGKEPILTNEILANIFWMEEKELTEGNTLFFKCATQEVPAEIKEIKKRIDSSTLRLLSADARKLKNLEIGEVIIETRNPVVITKFNQIPELGRFVLMLNKEICAGGIII